MGHLKGSHVRLARGRARAFAIVAALALVGALGTPGAASAGLPQEYAVFSDCPVTNPSVELCVVSNVTSGEFVMGSKTVPINRAVTLQGGLAKGTLVPAADGNTLSKTPLQLPGGLAGTELFPPLTEVNATAELAGTAHVDLENTARGQGTAVALPVKVKLDNPTLGSACYIGSDSEPVALNLTTGTTNPPPPNKPISGKPGNIDPTTGGGKIITVTNNSLVDNAFAAPGVNGCGGALAVLVDPLVNVDAGLPSAPGHNTAIMNGITRVTEPRMVIAQAALPEFGRCKKVPGERGKGPFEIHYHGGYNEAGCIEQNTHKFGEYEWTPGAGARKSFTATAGATTLETTGKAKLTCKSATSSGEYTGVKTTTMTVHLNGCALAGAHQAACQSAGAAAGEIVTSPLDGKLGFIQDEVKGATPLTVVGLDLSHAPTLLTAECGSGKVPVSLSGSVIGVLTPIDKMSSSFALKFTQSAGKQSPEQFESGPKDTLSASIGSGATEAAGLGSKVKLANEEKLAIKAEVE